MMNRQLFLGRVRLAQIPNWGPATAPAAVPGNNYQGLAQAQAESPAVALAPKPDLANTLYTGGAVIAIVAALGAIFS